MAERLLTAGAQRAISRAEELARRWAHPELLPAHLLWSLLQEESEAFELLTDAGLTIDELKLCDIWEGQYPAALGESAKDVPTADSIEAATTPLAADIDDAAAALADAVTSALAGALGDGAAAQATPDQSGDWQRIILCARHLAGRQKPAVEISTLHLLTALLTESSPVSTILAQFGVESESAATSDSGRTSLEPVAVSFELDWNADSVDRTATYRILDASANRLREGLRVVEDFVRFVLDDAHLARLTRNCRHQLRSLFETLNVQDLIASRDTQADVGTTIHTKAEGQRETPFDVATASLKRAQEAARTLEEYSKLLTTDGAAQDSVPLDFGQLRYELYTLEKAILSTVATTQQLADRRLYLLLTAELCPGNVEQTLKDALAGGVDIVQLREKTLPDRDLLEFARRVREITRNAGALMIMNDRPDLAVLCDADGVHVGQEELSVQEVRRIVGPQRLVGVSTHTIEQARQAVLDGASYLGVGPVFQSQTKAFAEFAGLDFVRAVAQEIALPWYPIGGITAESLPRVTDAGATRAAICGGILQARSPVEASRYVADELRAAAAARRLRPS